LRLIKGEKFMETKKTIYLLIGILMLTLLMVACSSQETQKPADTGNTSKAKTSETKNSTTENKETTTKLPEKMTWSVYDVGSGGYAEMSAIANALTEKQGTRIRMLPSASGVGRMIPLRDETASIGKLGDEIQFAFEGTHEFSQPSWGPQDVRSIWAPMSTYGFAVVEESGIKSIADLKGKRVPQITGNSSVNIKTEAILAFAGLTWDDVEVVQMSSYSGQADALVQGKIDVASMKPTASALLEADSKRKLAWLPLAPNDTAGWDRLQKITPWLVPQSVGNGAGMEEPVPMIGYGYLVAGYAKVDPNTIYQLLKAMDENFDKYKDAMPDLKYYAKDQVLTEPKGIPFHEGTVKFFKENGLWSEEKEAKNNALIERYKKLKEAWDQVVDESVQKQMKEKDFAEYWLKRKAELID
jgi:TRAP transporter TAXI family solute receptor